MNIQKYVAPKYEICCPKIMKSGLKGVGVHVAPFGLSLKLVRPALGGSGIGGGCGANVCLEPVRRLYIHTYMISKQEHTFLERDATFRERNANSRDLNANKDGQKTKSPNISQIPRQRNFGNFGKFSKMIPKRQESLGIHMVPLMIYKKYQKDMIHINWKMSQNHTFNLDKVFLKVPPSSDFGLEAKILQIG